MIRMYRTYRRGLRAGHGDHTGRADRPVHPTDDPGPPLDAQATERELSAILGRSFGAAGQAPAEPADFEIPPPAGTVVNRELDLVLGHGPREDAPPAPREQAAHAEARTHAQPDAWTGNETVTTTVLDIPEILERHAGVFERLTAGGGGLNPLELEPVVADLLRHAEALLFWPAAKVAEDSTEPGRPSRGKALHLARVAALALHLGLRHGYGAKELRGLGLCALLHHAEGLRWFLKTDAHDYARILRVAEAYETLTVPPPRPDGAVTAPTQPHDAAGRIARGTGRGLFQARFVKLLLETPAVAPLGGGVSA